MTQYVTLRSSGAHDECPFLEDDDVLISPPCSAHIRYSTGVPSPMTYHSYRTATPVSHYDFADEVQSDDRSAIRYSRTPSIVTTAGYLDETELAEQRAHNATIPSQYTSSPLRYKTSYTLRYDENSERFVLEPAHVTVHGDAHTSAVHPQQFYSNQRTVEPAQRVVVRKDSTYTSSPASTYTSYGSSPSHPQFTYVSPHGVRYTRATTQSVDQARTSVSSIVPGTMDFTTLRVVRPAQYEIVA